MVQLDGTPYWEDSSSMSRYPALNRDLDCRCRGDWRRDYRPDGGVSAEARRTVGRRHRSRAQRRRRLRAHDRARHLRHRFRPHGPRQTFRAGSCPGGVGCGTGGNGRDRHHRDHRRHRLRLDVGPRVQVRRARRRSRERASAPAGRGGAGGRIGIRSDIPRHDSVRWTAGGCVRRPGEVSPAEVPGGARKVHRWRRIARVRAYRIRGSRRRPAVGQGRRAHDLVQERRASQRTRR